MKKLIFTFIAILYFSVCFAQRYEVWVKKSDASNKTKGNYGFSYDPDLIIDSKPSILFTSKDTYFAVEDTTTSDIKMYKIWLTLNNEQLKTKGIFYQSKASSILIAPLVNKRQFLSEKYLTEFQIKDIETIKLRKNKKVGKSVLIGAITGLAVGGLIGLMSGDDPPGTFLRYTAEEKALFLGVPLAVGGAGIGAIVGSVKIKIPINGNSDKYKNNKTNLIEYSIKK